MVYFKTGKSWRIYDGARRKILEDYFWWMVVQKICTKYWYKENTVRKFLSWKATKIYTDSKWIEWRRCSRCWTYKTVDEYANHQVIQWKQYVKPHCRSCWKIVQKNRIVIKKNTDNYYDIIYWRRLAWYRHWWRYNFRRRILRVIWYLDRKWKIIWNKKERI